MMTQTAPEGEPHFVNTMLAHTQMCGQMARAFGNDRFERPQPFDEVIYVVENHDRGWDHYDANPGIDPATRLPYIMVRTPTPDLVKTNRGSPDFNEQHHGYCGLLSSMHTVGLYNGRYGLSSFVARTQSTTSIDVAKEHRGLIDEMLAHEEERQARLKSALYGRTGDARVDRRGHISSKTTSSSSSSTPCRSISTSATPASAATRPTCTCRSTPSRTPASRSRKSTSAPTASTPTRSDPSG